MKRFAPLLGLALATSLVAQSPLNTIMTGVNNMGADGAMLFTMTVTVPSVTVNRIDINSVTAAGTHARMRFWQTNTGFPGFSGSEGIAANWTLLAEGSVITAGVGLATTCCFPTPVTLTSAMGSRGYAVELIGAVCAYTTGNGANQNYNNGQLSLACGAAIVGSNIAEQDSSGSVPRVPPFAGEFTPFNPRVFNGAIHYAVGTSAPVCSYSHAVGQRCGGSFNSFYDLRQTPAGASAGLTGRQITMVPNGQQYTVISTVSPGIVPSGAHAALSGWASTIVATPAVNPLDDGEVVVPLTTPFPFPSGVATSLVVHNNGIISVGSNMAFLDALLYLGNSFDDWAPNVPSLLNAPNASWWVWHDFNLAIGGSVKFAEVGTVAIITFEGVPTAGGTLPNTSTFQIAFDSSSGVVTMTFDTIETLGAPNPVYAGNPWLVGYSEGGTSLRPNVERDISVDFVYDLTTVENASLTLTADPRPVQGSIISYRVANAVVPELGQLYFSLSNPFAPGFPLAALGIGKPDCMLNFDLSSTIGPFTYTSTAAPVFTLDTNTGASVLGLEFWCQAVGLDLLAVDLFAGLHTSNALHQRVELN